MIITGRAPGEQTCWSEPWTGFSARTGLARSADLWASDHRGPVADGTAEGEAAATCVAHGHDGVGAQLLSLPGDIAADRQAPKGATGLDQPEHSLDHLAGDRLGGGHQHWPRPFVRYGEHLGTSECSQRERDDKN